MSARAVCNKTVLLASVYRVVEGSKAVARGFRPCRGLFVVGSCSKEH